MRSESLSHSNPPTEHDHLPLWRVVDARLMSAAIGIVRPLEITNEYQGLEDVERAVEDGDGVIAIWDHTKFTDGFDAACVFTKSKVLQNEKALYPVTRHQEKPIFPMISGVTGFEYPYVATKNYKEYVRGDGLIEYLDRSKEILRHGGIVSVAFQATREAYLDMDKQAKTMSTLVKKMARERSGTDKKAPEHAVNNFVFLPLGLGEKDSNGLIKRKVAAVNVGPCLTLDKVMEAVDGDISKIDNFFYTLFQYLVDPEYLIPPEYRSSSPEPTEDGKSTLYVPENLTLYPSKDEDYAPESIGAMKVIYESRYHRKAA